MKRLSSLIICILLALTAMAGSVNKQTALEKARQFMPGKQFVESKTVLSGQAKAPEQNKAFYIFNAADKGGFVIVSGDDRTEAILGYGESGNLDENTMPDNLKWWLDGYARQIAALGTQLTPVLPTDKILQAPAIFPLIASRWNQYAPYNYMCPDGNYRDYDESGYDADNRCVTGCTATAMAQIMYYWKWPEGCPALESYDIIKGLPATTFKWDQMKDTYESGETGASANAVAELMRYCGQALKVDYSPSGSAGYIAPEILVDTFLYSPNCKAVMRDNYSTSRWESIVYDELAAGRPVLYSGQRSGGGHQFIVDGYDGNGRFHINWGWGGYCDSYFILSLADPYVGTKNEGNGYQFNQHAILGVQPAKEGEEILPVMYNDVPNTCLTKTYSRSSASADFMDVELYGDVFAICNKEPQSERSAEVGWGVFQDGSLQAIISSKTIKLEKKTYQYYNNDIVVSWGAGLSDGTYELVQIYRFEGETQWTECDPSYSPYLVAEVTEQNLTVLLPNRGDSSFTVNSITLPKESGAGETINLKANITGMAGMGGLGTFVISLWVQKQGEATWTNIAKKSYDSFFSSLYPDVIIPFRLDEPGTYNLKITNGSDETELSTATLIVAAAETVVIDGISYFCLPMYGHAKIIYNKEADNRVSSLNIKSSVTASGVECKVICIADSAFFDYYRVQSIIVPEGVETIGERAFGAMSSLTKLVLPSTLKEIGAYVIDFCFSLQTVESKTTTPPSIGENTFCKRIWNSETWKYDLSPSPATLYIPIGTKSLYEAIAGWTMFNAIVESDEVGSGILVLSSQSEADNTIYNLQGVRQTKLRHGINIIGGKKVVVK